MPKYLCLMIRFLQPYSHGRADSTEPEWPPSPLRLFQALVAASAARWNERMRLAYAVPALEWLEGLPAPTIVACQAATVSRGYRMYVPDNTGDRVASSWSGGRKASIADYRTEKDIRPKKLGYKRDNEDDNSVHYLFELAEGDSEIEKHWGVLQAASQSITHVGWGIDMVVGDAKIITEDERKKLKGETWAPTRNASGSLLRVAVRGTLKDLQIKHEAFLNRVEGDQFRVVAPLIFVDRVFYQSSSEPIHKPFVAFDILQPNGEGFRIFNTTRAYLHVSGHVRHTTGQICQGWPFGETVSFVHGHDQDDYSQPLRGEFGNNRFMFLPIPTIEMRKEKSSTFRGGERLITNVTDIRRVLICAPVEFKDRVEWIRRRLSGQALYSTQNVNEEIAELNYTQRNNSVIQQYVKPSQTWSTVTPVILPGYDDRNDKKAEGLLRKAFVQAGISEELCEIEELVWRNVGYFRGLGLASQYAVPKDTTEPRYHVKVRFNRPIVGPLTIGKGRFRGCGLFAAHDS